MVLIFLGPNASDRPFASEGKPLSQERLPENNVTEGVSLYATTFQSVKVLQ